MDAAKYYALLRFQEAAVAMQAAFHLNLVDKLSDRELTFVELRDEFGFTHQGARTYAILLEVMEVLANKKGKWSVTERAQATLTAQAPTSRRPYLALGAGDDCLQLIDALRGKFPDEYLPVYGGDATGATLMDDPVVAKELAIGLSSRARNFAQPLASLVSKYGSKGRILADIGAGSPYVAQACLTAMPHLSKVILVDRENGLKYAREMAKSAEINTDRIDFVAQDFFQDVPAADIYVVSNTVHDWLPSEYQEIMTNVRDALAPGGIVCVHEPLLLATWNSADEWVRALWMACYALTLYKLTSGKGTCYTHEEHNEIMGETGFEPLSEPAETSDGCSAVFYKLTGDPHAPSATADHAAQLRTS